MQEECTDEFLEDFVRLEKKVIMKWKNRIEGP